MADTPTLADYENAKQDLDAIGLIVNGAADLNGNGSVPTRAGGSLYTLAHLIAQFPNASADAISAAASATDTLANKVASETAAGLVAAAMNSSNAPYPNAYASALPRGVLSVTIGGSAITGATVGEYPIIGSGGSITGYSLTLVVTSPTTATVRVDGNGLGTGTTPPTLTKPAGATLPAGTTITAVVGLLVPNQATYWVASADSSQILLYGNNGGSVATAPFGGTQLVMYAKSSLDQRLSAVPVLSADTDGIPWLHADAKNLSGLAAGLTWTAPALLIANAIKFAALSGSGIGASEDYFISEFNVADAVKGDQIVVRRNSDNAVVANSTTATITKNASGTTLVTFFSAVYKIRVTLLIDYRDFGASTGTIYSSTNRLLVFKRGDGHVARLSLLGRTRNQALDPGLVNGASASTWQVSGGSVTSAPAGAALAALGITNSIAIGAGTTVTGGTPFAYKLEYPDGRANSKFGIASILVSTADSAQWPGTFTVVAYSAATGGTQVTLTTQPTFFEEITSTLRRYWLLWRNPDATIGRFAIGFTSLNTSAAMEAGGFTFALSDGELIPGNVALYDWNAYDLRDDQRAVLRSNVSGIQSGLSAITRLNYGNLMINPVLDPAAQAKKYLITPAAVTTPTSPIMAALGCVNVIKCGVGGSNFYIYEPIFDRDSGGKSIFLSALMYSSNGANYAGLRAVTYKGATATDTFNLSFSNKLDLGGGVWLIYGSFTLPSSPDYTAIAFGVPTAAGVANVEVSGFQIMVSDTVLTFANTPRYDWFYMRSVVERAGFGRFWNKKWVQLGDSIMESYDVPELFARLTGVNLLNGGFGGCLMSKFASPSGQNVYRNDMSGVAVADAVSSGSWTAMENAASAMASLYADDNTAIVARMKAYDWTSADYIGIAYGTNDQSNNQARGSATGTTTTTFNGAINYSVPLLQAAAVKAQIAFFTPTWRGPAHASGDSNLNANGNGDFMSDFQDAIAARCRYHAIPSLNLHEALGINLGNASAFLQDGLHPTRPRGSVRWSKAMAALAGAIL